MKELLVACVLLTALAVASRADAADLSLPLPVKAATTLYGYDWSGFYAGGRVGYAWGTSNWTASTPGAPNVSGSLDLFQPFDAFKDTGSFSQGLQAGYNYMLPNRIVVGAEADVTFPGFPNNAGISIGGISNLAVANARGGNIQRDRAYLRHRARPHRLCARQLAVLCNGRIRLDL